MVEQHMMALAAAFVAMAPKERRPMPFTEQLCASLAIIVSNCGEARVCQEGSDVLYVARMPLDAAEAQAMRDAGWREGSEGWWTL